MKILLESAGEFDKAAAEVGVGLCTALVGDKAVAGVEVGICRALVGEVCGEVLVQVVGGQLQLKSRKFQHSCHFVCPH